MVINKNYTEFLTGVARSSNPIQDITFELTDVILSVQLND